MAKKIFTRLEEYVWDILTWIYRLMVYMKFPEVGGEQKV